MNTRLVLQAQKRDKDAFVTLIGLYRESMYQIAYAILKNNEDAADAMQDTILICWEKIDTLRHARYFKTWITRILINRCNRLYSQRSRTTDLNEGTFRFHLAGSCRSDGMAGNDAAVDRQPAHRGGTLLCPAIQNTRNRRYFGHNAKCREKPAAHSQKSFKAIYFFQFMIHQERSFYEHI